MNMHDDLLRDVSRSFFLSLRVLPGKMRPAASGAYLLARLSDTVADCEVPIGVRKRVLAAFDSWLDGDQQARDLGGDLRKLAAQVENPGERNLLERADEVLAAVRGLETRQWELVREVVRIITSGQRLDLEWFGEQGGKIPDAVALEDYAWRVAGCVGEFWTKLGFLTCGDQFSDVRERELLERGRRFGMGLQLVNILRDVRNDLALGRRYLPEENGDFMDAHRRWRAVARRWLADGMIYGQAMKSWRLRVAVLLPARLGLRTLDLLERKEDMILRERIKVGRCAVYRALCRSFFPW